MRIRMPLVLLAAGAAFLLAACGQAKPLTGETVRRAVAAQTLNPAAGGDAPVLGMDGESARNAIDSYQAAFKAKQEGGGVLEQMVDVMGQGKKP